MRTIGFVISHKEQENRRALLPEHLKNIRNTSHIYLESGYGEVLGFSDEEYAKAGAHICPRQEAMTCDIICDPKAGDGEYLSELHNQTVFGWMHVVQNKDVTDKVIASGLTAYAWEDMFDGKQHIFWRNNELAGKAAVTHACLCHGALPEHAKAAILGKGNTARGALTALQSMGAEITVYGRENEALFRSDLPIYDIIVNAILWDTRRKDHIIYREDLKRMMKGALIIDISCDRAGGVETSIPTTISKPIYSVEGITHYVVDNTPSLFYKTASKYISEVVSMYCDDLIEGKDNLILQNAKCIEKGHIIDQRINEFQHRS